MHFDTQKSIRTDKPNSIPKEKALFFKYWVFRVDDYAPRDAGVPYVLANLPAGEEKVEVEKKQ